MEKKGLCVTCIHESVCIFPKQPMVWQCEEFSDYLSGTYKLNRLKQKKAVCATRELEEGQE